MADIVTPNLDPQTNEPVVVATQPADVQVSPSPDAGGQPAKALPSDEDDPIIQSMRAAEDEIAKGEPAPGTVAENALQPGTEGQPAAPAAQTAPNPETPAAGVMIPKPRFDEVLTERDQYRQHANYLQGVVDTQTHIIRNGAAPGATPLPGASPTPQGPTMDEQITQVEAKKLELAQKFDDGDLSTREYQEQNLTLDRQLRGLTDARSTALIEQARATATTATQKVLLEGQVSAAALDIQRNHPYVAEIDRHPNGAAIWNMLTSEAKQTLFAKGINPDDGSAASRVALMNEKAALTDKYGPSLTGKTIAPATSSTPTPQPAPGKSPTALAREAKIEVSTQQPPASGQLGSSGLTNQITDEDILKMSQDEIANLPASVLRRYAGI